MLWQTLDALLVLFLLALLVIAINWLRLPPLLSVALLLAVTVIGVAAAWRIWRSISWPARQYPKVGRV